MNILWYKYIKGSGWNFINTGLNMMTVISRIEHGVLHHVWNALFDYYPTNNTPTSECCLQNVFEFFFVVLEEYVVISAAILTKNIFYMEKEAPRLIA